MWLIAPSVALLWQQQAIACQADLATLPTALTPVAQLCMQPSLSLRPFPCNGCSGCFQAHALVDCAKCHLQRAEYGCWSPQWTLLWSSRPSRACTGSARLAPWWPIGCSWMAQSRCVPTAICWQPMVLMSLHQSAYGWQFWLLEPSLDPAVEQQAIARVHRISQTRPVMAYWLLKDGSIEVYVQYQLALDSVKLMHLAESILMAMMNAHWLRQGVYECTHSVGAAIAAWTAWRHCTECRSSDACMGCALLFISQSSCYNRCMHASETFQHCRKAPHDLVKGTLCCRRKCYDLRKRSKPLGETGGVQMPAELPGKT